MAILNKNEVVEVLVRLTGENRQTCEKVYAAMIQTMHDGLLAGHEFKFKGLGIFTTRLVQGRTMKSPATGQMVEVPTRLSPTVRWSSTFKAKFKED